MLSKFYRVFFFWNYWNIENVRVKRWHISLIIKSKPAWMDHFWEWRVHLLLYQDHRNHTRYCAWAKRSIAFRKYGRWRGKKQDLAAKVPALVTWYTSRRFHIVFAKYQSGFLFHGRAVLTVKMWNKCSWNLIVEKLISKSKRINRLSIIISTYHYHIFIVNGSPTCFILFFQLNLCRQRYHFHISASCGLMNSENYIPTTGRYWQLI